MREDCLHFESRTYDDDGEVARFCTKGLAPEAPWKCPENCGSYERIQFITADFDKGSLGKAPEVEAEPDDDPQDIIDVLADAEAIVDGAEADVIADLDREQQTRKRTPWWRRKRGGGSGGDDGDFRISNR